MSKNTLQINRKPIDRSRLSLSGLSASDRKSFVINLWIEEQFVETGPALSTSFRLAGGSGKKHDVFFCHGCGTYLWSRYHGAPSALFVRAGTLDRPKAVKPDVHIFTRSKLPWLNIPEGVPTFEAFYKIGKIWPAESKRRLRLHRSS